MSIKARCETLPQWLTWLETAHPEHDIELSLERIKSVATDMALLKPAPFVITVAGTNGKGSTIALLESILLAAGYKVGVFTSPHFLHFNERIHINGNRIDNESLCSAFAAIDE
ncbi:MAG: bifunctional tetrahydrofolate synthase/dihydrofolate synthase, partial [Endozoicomonas sp. (ex Botrylloides leachii)]|nr:bifunctional tetrahydrofolate synthase/dihydrofolate synthase [Endozoicomonas sp. (ex Botrylloides leachii)]